MRKKNESGVVVAKFGGSSVASKSGLAALKSFVLSEKRQKIVIISAIGKGFGGNEKLTDLLLKLHALTLKQKSAAGAQATAQSTARELLKTKNAIIKKLAKLIENAFNVSFKQASLAAKSLYEKHLCENAVTKSADYCVSRGEYLTCKILSRALGAKFLSAEHAFYAYSFCEKTIINERKTRAALTSALSERKTLFLPGFYCNVSGKIKLFPRGGGDLSGAIAARHTNLALYKNYTDVDGIKNAPPDIIKSAKTFKRISYADLKRLIFSGAEVLSKEATALICAKKIKTQILNSNNILTRKTLTAKKRKCAFKAICVKNEQCGSVITILGKSFKSKKFRKAARLLLTKNNVSFKKSVYNKNGASFCVKQADADKTVKLLYYNFLTKVRL